MYKRKYLPYQGLFEMELPCRWAVLYLLIYFSIDIANVFCQNIALERVSPEVSTQNQIGNLIREVTPIPSPSKAQLINELFTYATAKGLLPKTTKIIQSTLPQEVQQIVTSQNAPRLYNIVPFQSRISSNCENNPIISSIPSESFNCNQNQITLQSTLPQVQPQIATSQNAQLLYNIVPLQPQISSNCEMKPIVSSTPAETCNSIQTQVSPITSYYQAIQSEPISWNFAPQTCQGGCLENCACAQPFPGVRPIPQPPQPIAPINNYCPPNQYVAFNEATLPCINPFNIPIPLNTECYPVDNVYETSCGSLSEEPLSVTCDSKPGIPINLQINIPSPNDLCPTITIVTAAPTNSEPITAFAPYMFPPPPIVMRRPRSCLRKLLPLLLLALIDDCGSCGGYGCPYNCDSEDAIPIPYPIPIPTNNPVINGCNFSYSSRN